MAASSKPFMRSIKSDLGKQKKGARKSLYQKKRITTAKGPQSSGRKVKDNKKRSVRRGVSEISQRKRAEEALRESEEKYRSLASTADSMYLVDRECRYIFMNEGHLSRFGLAWGEIVGRSYSEFHSEEDTRHFVENVERVFETGKSFQTEHKSHRDNKYFLRTFSPVVDSKGSTFAITIVSKDITARRQAEEALRKSASHLRAMAIELSSSEERERQRLAIFLHDEIGQTLALLRIKFGDLAGAWRPKSGKQSIRQIRDLLEKAIDQAHTLTFELSPPILHQLGLEAAVEWAGEKISQDHGIDFTLNDDGVNKPLDADLKTLLFTCVRELMLNTVKHAKAKRLSVKIAREGEKILMTIADDGIGFDTSLLENHPAQIGFGLFSVRERLAAVDGTFELRSEPDRGTRITLSVPLKEEIPSS
jgi:PAS domain S-box-containing protein